MHLILDTCRFLTGNKGNIVYYCARAWTTVIYYMFKSMNKKTAIISLYVWEINSLLMQITNTFMSSILNKFSIYFLLAVFSIVTSFTVDISNCLVHLRRRRNQQWAQLFYWKTVLRICLNATAACFVKIFYFCYCTKLMSKYVSEDHCKSFLSFLSSPLLDPTSRILVSLGKFTQDTLLNEIRTPGDDDPSPSPQPVFPSFLFDILLSCVSHTYFIKDSARGKWQ